MTCWWRSRPFTRPEPCRMPELPEVETTRRGISRHVTGQRNHRPRHLPAQPALAGTPSARQEAEKPVDTFRITTRQIPAVGNRCRAPYRAPRHVRQPENRQQAMRPAQKHDHVDFVLGRKILRFHDPRRFGSIHWTRRDPLQHKLLHRLGPEPLSDAFNGRYLYGRAASRKGNVKGFIMNSEIVAGVGNIYASEALFLSGIHPQRAANRIALNRYEKLAESIKKVLGKGHRFRGHHVAGFPARGWQAGLLRPRTERLRPCRKSVPAVRPADPGSRAGPAQQLFLQPLPALTGPHAVRSRRTGADGCLPGASRSHPLIPLLPCCRSRVDRLPQ